MNMAVQEVLKSQMTGHLGRFFRLAANQYPTVVDVILEIVQNAIDSGGSDIAIILDKNKRRIVVMDNGEGASDKKFDLALQSVGVTLKTTDKLGQFGLGLISPLGKCSKFTFTSCPKGIESGYREWTFESDKIMSLREGIYIPCEPLTGYRFSRAVNKKTAGLTYVTWRTKVTLHNYSKDVHIGRIGNIDELIKLILDRFSVAMHKKKVKLSVRLIDTKGHEYERKGVEAKPFSGEPLDVVSRSNLEGGKTTFRLFLARREKGKVKGKVQVGVMHNDFRFSFTYFARQAEGTLSEDAISALKSGVFEGEIIGEKVELHETRKSFVKNEAFQGFCEAIERWFEDVGMAQVLELEESRKDEWYQNLALRSLKTLEDMFKKPEFEAFADLLETFRTGSVGKEHFPPEDRRVLGVQAKKSRSVVAASKKSNDHGSNTPSEKSNPETDRPEHHPLTATGPKGQHRKLVRSSSLGLQFNHDPMFGDDRLWVMDERNGILTFNIRHPLWEECENSTSADRKLLQLQEIIAVHALQLLTVPDSMVAVMRTTIDEAIRAQAFLIHNSPCFTPGKKLMD